MLQTPPRNRLEVPRPALVIMSADVNKTRAATVFMLCVWILCLGPVFFSA